MVPTAATTTTIVVPADECGIVLSPSPMLENNENTVPFTTMVNMSIALPEKFPTYSVTQNQNSPSLCSVNMD